jgi:hypothetical protein
MNLQKKLISWAILVTFMSTISKSDQKMSKNFESCGKLKKMLL